MVANRHLPYEAVLDESFSRIDRRVESGGFKVYAARR
jgi:16S rRNA (guanine1207-N2)-methyltransferase